MTLHTPNNNNNSNHDENGNADDRNNKNAASSSSSFQNRFLLRRPRPLSSSKRAVSASSMMNHSLNNNNHKSHWYSHYCYGLTFMVVVTFATLGTTSVFMELWVSSSVILSSTTSSRLQSLNNHNDHNTLHLHDTTNNNNNNIDPSFTTNSLSLQQQQQSHLRTSSVASTRTTTEDEKRSKAQNDDSIPEKQLLLSKTTTSHHRPSVEWRPRIVHFKTNTSHDEKQNHNLPKDTRLTHPLKKEKTNKNLVEEEKNKTIATTPSTFVTLSQDENYFKVCKPMAPWQTTSFPNCNSLHEIQLTAPEFVLVSLQGSWRSVWKYYYNNNNAATTTTTTTTSDAVVVKLLKFERREFDHESYELHRVDALAMERLTHSPNIVHAFGFCGQSVVTELADAGISAREFLKNNTLTPLDRLKIARDLAGAMKDLHSIDYPNATNVTFVHNDVNMANLVQVQGRIKLNDFNIGVLQRWNTTSNSSTCRSPVLFAQPLWKSPEEQPTPPNPNTTIPSLNTASTIQFVENAAATDVYGLGNLLFQVLTARQPWTHLEPNGALAKDQVVQLKLAGGKPFIPPEFSNSTDRAVQVLYQVTMACFATDPKDRPTSHEGFRTLDEAVRSLEAIETLKSDTTRP